MDPKPHADPMHDAEVFHPDDYEVEYLARKSGLTAEQARDLIDRHGADPDALERAAAMLRRH